MQAGGTDLTTVRADGLVSVKAGGLEVEQGGATVAAGTLYVDAGQIITAGGLNVQAGGQTIETVGLNILNGGATVRHCHDLHADIATLINNVLTARCTD